MSKISKADIRDTIQIAMERANGLLEEFGGGIVGFGHALLLDGDMKPKQVVPFANLITTAGDQYYAQKAIVGVAPASPTAPTAVSGMKLGTTATAAAKSGAGASLVAYLTGSNAAFDASFPTAAAVSGTDTGWQANYKTTWAAGIATSATINEVAMVNDAATNATATAANTYARAVLGTINKAAADTLAITWSHKFLGS